MCTGGRPKGVSNVRAVQPQLPMPQCKQLPAVSRHTALLAWREGRGVCRYAILRAHHEVTMVIVIIVPVMCTGPHVRRLGHAGQAGRIWHVLWTQAAVPCACLLVA